jgi:hypothetical protein
MNPRFLLAANILEDLIDDVPVDTADSIRDILDEIERLVLTSRERDEPAAGDGVERYSDVLAESLRRVARSLDPSHRIH